MSQIRVKDYTGKVIHKKKRGFTTKKEALEWVYCIIIALVLAMLFRYFIGTPTIVKQVSMYPTLVQDERLWLNRWGRTTKTLPDRGEIITFEEPAKITYTEPISLENFSPTAVLPGETITLTGDYLNLMQKVIFAEEVEVNCADFIEHTRQRITLTVPEEAQSGLIILSDTAEIPNQIYSEEELTVILPSVNNVSQLNNAKPGNTVEIQGQHLNLVKQVRTSNGSEAEFVVTNDEILRFEIPADAADGDVVMIPASGVEVTIAHLAMAVPTEVQATPATGVRAGNTITLTGKDMGLITNVTFPNVSEPVALASQTEEQATVVMPEMAQSGNLMLNTGSGKQ